MDQPTRRRKIQVDLVKEKGEGRKQCIVYHKILALTFK